MWQRYPARMDIFTLYALLLKSAHAGTLVSLGPTIDYDPRLSDGDRRTLQSHLRALQSLDEKQPWPFMTLDEVQDGVAKVTIHLVQYAVPVDYWIETDRGVHVGMCTVTGPATIMSDGEVTGVCRKLNPDEESRVSEMVTAHIEAQASRGLVIADDN